MTEELLAKLRADRKYGDIHPYAIRRAIEDAQQRYNKPKDIEKAARERLHGISASFNEMRNVDPSSEGLEAQLMRHVSTRERLPLARMDALYARIFAVTGEPRSIIDLACGLNPLYLLRRWGCPVTGVDLSRSCIDCLSREPNFTGIWADLLCGDAIPVQRFHIALLLKLLPLLERQCRGAAGKLLNAIDAEFLVVSFPTRTRSGRNVNMEGHYSAWMEAHLPAGHRQAAKFCEGNELFYILRQDAAEAFPGSDRADVRVGPDDEPGRDTPAGKQSG